MSFFLPRRLIELEYFETDNSEIDEEYVRLTTEYADDIDFAFYVVNFGYSREDYEQLTPRDKAFIRKAYETKTVQETSQLRNAVLNAVSNALRKKNARFQKLWKKVQKPLDKERARNDTEIIIETEEKEGKSWVDKIYEANGLRR